MISKLDRDQELNLYHQALNLRTARQELLSSNITTVPLTFKVETSEYERGDSGYADHLVIKPSSHVFQIN